MDIGSLLILLGITALVVVFVARPLMERTPRAEGGRSLRLSNVQAELDRVMGAIQDLDMDHAMGKVVDPEYGAQRAALVQRGASLMRDRDAVLGAGGRATADDRDRVDTLIETEVARLRSGSPDSFCGNCGQPAQAGDRFCIRCGKRLELDQAGA